MKTFFDLLNKVELNYLESNFLSLTVDSVTQTTSYKKFLSNVANISYFLAINNFHKNDKAIIMLNSSPTWLSIDLGIMKAGLVSVPMFSNLAFSNMLHQFENCEAKIIFIQNESTFNIIQNTNFKFELIVSLEPLSNELLEANKHLNIVSLTEMILEGSNSAKQVKDKMLQIEQEAGPNDTATIIYTSGTSGKPKGVELTHNNLISQLVSIDKDYSNFLISGEDSIFAFLPLAHIFQRTVTYYFLYKCIDCRFSNDVKSIADNLEQFKPAAVAVVPRFLEKVKNGLNEKLQKESSIIKRLIGKLCFQYAVRHNPESAHSIFHPLFDKLMYSKIRNKLGGKLKVMLTGGAALNDELYRFFINIGVPLYQGYGLTETSPVVAVGTPKANKLYTIGKPIDGVQVKLTEEKELLVKGPNVMKGYYRADEEGARAIDENGFLYTGDLAEIDNEGYIKIIGRKKEQFKTSNGKFINPIKIEALLNAIPYIETSCVIAEGRPFVTVVLFPNDSGVENFAQLELELATQIRVINEKLDRHENIHYFYLHNKPATVEDCQLTPSLKIVRKVIEEQFKVQIDDFYSRFH